MLETESRLQNLQSETISLLRFPMALLVILIHTDSYYWEWKPEIDPLTFEGVCFVLGHVVRLIAGIAVPVFFMISGFLFFLNFREFSWDGYQKKMKSRLHSLIIPYVLWNVVVFLALFAGKIAMMYWKSESWDYVTSWLAEKSWHFVWDVNHWGDVNHPWLWWTSYSTGPIDFPLWFLRDLIVVTVLTPLIYLAVKKLKIFAVILLFAAYVSDFWVVCPGFRITAFFYFGLGAYLAINGMNLVETFRKCRTVIFPVAAVFFVLTVTHWIADDYKPLVRNVFWASAVMSSVIITSYLVENKGIRANKLLVNSCFFIYAAHAAALPKSPLWLVRGVLHKLIPDDSFVERIVCFLTVPCLTAAALVFAYWLLMRWFPRIMRIFCGGR